MVARWTEQQLAAHLRQRERKPAKKEQRKLPVPLAFPRPAQMGTYVVELPFLTPTPNQWQRMHFTARKRTMQQISACIAMQCPALVGLHLDKASIRITRFSSQEPDADAKSFCKPILDALQPTSKRHPYGMGAIIDDASENVELDPCWVRFGVKRGGVRIEVTPRE